MANEQYTIEALLRATDSGFSKTMQGATGDVEGLSKSTEKAAKKSGGFFDKIGSAVKVAGAAIATATGVAAAGTAALIKSVTANYGEYEQLVGGMAKLFGDDAATMLAQADRAFETAGMSANEYMQTATSFSASLISSLGGDTKEAARLSDVAIRAMSDNINTFGTDAESVQNAFKNFAKGQYVMLDNLSLGYAGSKEGMEQLLADAQAISGVKYDISSFADIIEAVQVMQEEFNIAGTTAAEAADTIEGSFGMLKGAWTDLITDLGNENANLDNSVKKVTDSIGAVINNLEPLFGRIIKALPTVFSGLGRALEQLIPTILSSITGLFSASLGMLIDLVPTLTPILVDTLLALADTIMAQIPSFLEAGVQILMGLVQGLVEAAPLLTENIIGLISRVALIVLENIPLLLQAGMDLVQGVIEGVLAAAPQLSKDFTLLLGTLIASIRDFLPLLLEQGIEIIKMLMQGISENAPAILSTITWAIGYLIDTIADMLPDIIDMGIELLDTLMQGIIDNLPAIATAILTVINKLSEALTKNMPTILKKGIELLVSLLKGILDTIPKIVPVIADVITALLKAIVNNLPLLIEAGIDLLFALLDGIIEALPAIIETVLDVIVEFIANIDKNLPKIIETGVRLLIKLGEGITKAIPKILALVPKIFGSLVDAFKRVDWASIGSNLVRGIWNGITSVKDWLLGKISGFVGSVLGGIKSFFGIKSPSKKTRYFGAMIGEGLGLGIEDEISAVEKSALALAEAATPSVSSALDLSHTGKSIAGSLNLSASDLGVQPAEQNFYFRLNNKTYRALAKGLTDEQDRELELVEVYG